MTAHISIITVLTGTVGTVINFNVVSDSCQNEVALMFIYNDFIFLAMLSTLMKLLLRVFRRGHGLFACFAVDLVDIDLSVCSFIAEDRRGGSCL